MPLCYSCEIISRAAAASRGRFERVKALQHPHHLRCGPVAFFTLTHCLAWPHPLVPELFRSFG